MLVLTKMILCSGLGVGAHQYVSMQGGGCWFSQICFYVDGWVLVLINLFRADGWVFVFINIILCSGLGVGITNIFLCSGLGVCAHQYVSMHGVWC